MNPLTDALLDRHAAVRTRAFAGLARVLAFLFPYRRFNLALTGYAPIAPEETRRSAAEAIRSWWEENRAEDW